MLNKLRAAAEKIRPEMQGGMVLSREQPHTRGVAHLPRACSGRETAEYYFTARYFRLPFAGDAEKTVAELSGLQNRNKSSWLYGCMRWYREEKEIADTNGAFFVLRPLALAYLLRSEEMSPAEAACVREMLVCGAEWFRRECGGALYYSNKVMSDGAMLTAISACTGLYAAEAAAFWKRWAEYVNNNGFGWGENTSACYSAIMLDALNMALLAGGGAKFAPLLQREKQRLLDYTAFHAGGEFVPSVRSYNFGGSSGYGSTVYDIFEHPSSLDTCEKIMSAVLYCETGTAKPDFSYRRGERKERVFGDVYAHTWNGRGVRLGSLTLFPAVPGCYQRESWGLGWQSMPVSASVQGAGTSFLRFQTSSGGARRSHPAVNKHEAYLSTKLFEGENIPDVRTECAQNGNLLLAVRSVEHIANAVSTVSDEWVAPRFTGRMRTAESACGTWHVFDYGHAALAVLPLACIAADGECRRSVSAEIVREGESCAVSVALHCGENALLFRRRLESAWLVAAFENAGWEQALSAAAVRDETPPEYCIPREDCMNRRRIRAEVGGVTVQLEIDPYRRA